jgi:hypothetical protein
MSEAEIARIEQAVGGGLPALYRSFLLTFGVSKFQNIVKFSPVHRFCHPRSRAMGAALSTRSMGSWSIGPTISVTRWRCIAMLVSGENSGAIHYWDHNNEWDEEDYLEDDLPVPPDLKWQNVTVIAPSFDVFLDRLSVYEQS